MNLCGLHDRSAAAASPSGTWIVDTVALAENPYPATYDANHGWLARLNYSYGDRTPNGTLPPPEMYNTFAAMVANYVAGSSGCSRWIIGNEPNLPVEWPDNEPIFPWLYAACYKLCRQAIRALPGRAGDEVLIAAGGPWNAQLKYADNPNGDWIKWFVDVMDALDGDFDGYALHAYTHGYNTALVTATTRMAPPFQNRYYEFYTYRDYCNAVPLEFKHLPAYLTEANGNGPWRSVGLMQAMLAEIDHWNKSGNEPQINCLDFYRFSEDDDYSISDKPEVMAEYYNAVDRGYVSPMVGAPETVPPTPQPPKPDPIDPESVPPTTPPGGSSSGDGSPPAGETGYLESWDSRLDQRGCELTVYPSVPAMGAGTERTYVWRCISGKWYDKEEAQGRVNTYLTLLDEAGNLIEGVPVKWYWSSGEDTSKKTEKKFDPWLGEYSLDYPMNAVAPSFGLVINDGTPSDNLWGMGLGDLEQPKYNIHTAYHFICQRIAEQTPEPPDPPIEKHTEYVAVSLGANLRAEPVNGAILVAVPYGDAVQVDGEKAGSDGYQWKHSTYQSYVGWIRGDLLSLVAPAPIPPTPIPPPSGGGLVHPLSGAYITQHFYQNPGDYAQWGLNGHDGTDFGGKPTGTAILAIAAGVVAAVGFDKDYGNYVRIAHGDLLAYSFYCHASKTLVAVGKEVEAGEVIAEVGSTGNSTGPHLHLEIRLAREDGSYSLTTPQKQGRVDPETWAAMYGLKL